MLADLMDIFINLKVPFLKILKNFSFDLTIY